MRRDILRAGRREIGGMLMGEEVGAQKFRVVDFSVDTDSGSAVHFVRDSEGHERALHEFFQKTGEQFRRYNYLGEWHTHPCFDIQPSRKDVCSMQDLVDQSDGVDFAVLFIARVNWLLCFQCNAYLFFRHNEPVKIDVLFESNKRTRS